MSDFATRLRADPPPLWLDAQAYAARLLAGGRAPWLEVTACVAWYGRWLGLLKPDVAELPLAPIVAAWLETHPGLCEAMAAKSRTGFALRTLVADAELREHLLTLTRALRTASRLPLVLVLPSPRVWLALAYRQAHGGTTEIEEDDIDSAAVHIADFLRGFGDAGIDALLLDERDDGIAAAPLALYQPVLNVADHYHWACGLRLADGQGIAGDGDGDGVDRLVFVIAPQPITGAVNGVSLPAGFWSGDAAPALTGQAFHHAEIPVDAEPERVLERLALLR